jgi:hypothetical protein
MCEVLDDECLQPPLLCLTSSSLEESSQVLIGLGCEIAWTIFHKVPLFTATKATFLCLCSSLVGKHDIINGNGNTLDN